MKYILSFIAVIFIPFILLVILGGDLDEPLYHSMLASVICYILHIVTSYRIDKFPGNNANLMVLPSIFTWYGIFTVLLGLFRVSYSLKYFILHFVFVFISSFVLYRLKKAEPKPKMHFIPLGKAKRLKEIDDVEWIELTDPDENISGIETLVVDLHSPKLTDEWQHFIATKTLAGVDVYNVRQIQASLTGRLRIRHMYENSLGSLQPSTLYSSLKRIMDIILVLASFPVTLPIMAITAIAIKLESEGGALFIQNRVGQYGKEFKIYKFRSMCKDSEKDGAKLASVGDMRVTRIGKFIRKTRIDELPQFFNVLKGDMALIGPRPEQKVFVDQFEKTIPFYNYRHIVKPGITGWAQVTHGYAATEDETQVKIEHDFYYITHFSFALDALIFFKTINTMLTGFGAR